MKIRSGFVSNSSSSSFIVAVDKKSSNRTKVKLTIEVNLRDYTDFVIKTVKKLDEYYLENLIFEFETIKEWIKEDDEGWAIEQYKVAKKAIENGKTILIGSLCDENDPEEAMLCNHGLEGIVGDDVEIIESEGGY